MRILLTRPDLPAGLNIVPQSAPPMGLMYLASYLLRDRPHDQLRLIDCVVDRQPPADIARAAASFKPDIIGISAMSIHAPVMHEIAKFARKELPDAAIIVGGPHAAASPNDILADPNITAAAVGEGEATFLDFVNSIENKRDLKNVAGLVLRGEAGKIIYTTEREPIQDLDSIPLPAWDMVGIEKFFDFKVLTQNNIRAHYKFTTIFTSRACPYRCFYCHNIFGKKFRARSVANVLDEMSILHDKYGIREFHLIDDCFNLDLERAREIMQAIIDRKWKIWMAFPNGIRADRLPDDFLEVMRRAGVYKMNFGIESGTKRIQALMNKNLDLSMVKNAIDRADRAGFVTHGFFMIGFPTETRAEMIETVEFACSSRLTMAGFFFVQPFPNTQLFNMAVSLGRRLPDVTGAEGCFSDVGVNLSAVGDEELNKIQRIAYRRFFMDPSRMLRLFTYLPRKMDFLEQFIAQWKVKFA